jgi:hypothetical protein
MTATAKQVNYLHSLLVRNGFTLGAYVDSGDRKRLGLKPSQVKNYRLGELVKHMTVAEASALIDALK